MTCPSKQASALHHASPVVLKGQSCSLPSALPWPFSTIGSMNQWHAGPTNCTLLELTEHSSSTRHRGSIKQPRSSRRVSMISFKEVTDLLLSVCQQTTLEKIPSMMTARLPESSNHQEPTTPTWTFPLSSHLHP